MNWIAYIDEKMIHQDVYLLNHNLVYRYDHKANRYYARSKNWTTGKTSPEYSVDYVSWNSYGLYGGEEITKEEYENY